MTKLGEVLRAGRKRKGLKASETVEALALKGQNISAKTLYGYENGTREPDNTTFLVLCSIYGITDILNEFGMKCEDDAIRTVVLAEEEYARMQKFRMLDSHGQMIVDALLDAEVGRVNVVPLPKKRPARKKYEPQKLRKLPLYYSAASAGTGVFAGEGDYESIAVADAVPQSAAYGVRISGNSMEPKIQDGAIVWVKEQPDVEQGEICIAVLNGDGYCKVKTREGLKSLNPKYKLIKISEYDEFAIKGKVVYIENPA